MQFIEITKEILYKNPPELLYYYNYFFYLNVKRFEIVKFLREARKDKIELYIKEFVKQFKILLLIFDKIIIPIEHILTLLEEDEKYFFTYFFNNKFIREALKEGLIIFSVWYTNETIESPYLLEVNKNYLVKCNRNKKKLLKPSNQIPISVDTIFFFKRYQIKENKVIRQSDFFTDKISAFYQIFNKTVNNNCLKELKKFIEDGFFSVDSKDAKVFFSIEKFYEFVKNKYSYRFLLKDCSEAVLNKFLKFLKSYYYLAAEDLYKKLFIPTLYEDELTISRNTNNILGILIHPKVIKKILERILKLELDKILNRDDFIVILKRIRKECPFKEFQNTFLKILEELSDPLSNFIFINNSLLEFITSRNLEDSINNFINKSLNKGNITSKLEKNYLKIDVKILPNFTISFSYFQLDLQFPNFINRSFSFTLPLNNLYSKIHILYKLSNMPIDIAIPFLNFHISLVINPIQCIKNVLLSLLKRNSL